MSKERYQRELAVRAGDTLPFTDGSLVMGVAGRIRDEIERFGHKGGSVIYPEPLTLGETRKVFKLLARSGLAKRVEYFCPIRLAEGVGTEIVIREK